MRSQPSFHQILLEKMSPEAHPIPEQPQDTSPAHMAFLLGELPVFRFAKAPSLRHRQSQSHGPSPKRKEPRLAQAVRAAPRPPGPAHPLNENQKVAKDWFAQHGESLLEDFTVNELKAAFRRLALRLHPDAQRGSTTLFIDLKHHRQQLDFVFKKV